MIFKEGEIKIDTIFKFIANLKIEDRIIRVSDFFINIPYKKNTIKGSAEIKEELTIDFEGVDCMTFIEYVEALRLSNDNMSFIENLKKVRYYNGIVDFFSRRHFFTDWDYLTTVKNITSEIGGEYVLTTSKELNKVDRQKKWIEGLPTKLRKIQFIPKNNILKILDKICSVLYCGFYSSKEGLDVSHVGILCKIHDNFVLRHASSIDGKVTEESFLEYAIHNEGIILYKPL